MKHALIITMFLAGSMGLLAQTKESGSTKKSMKQKSHHKTITRKASSGGTGIDMTGTTHVDMKPVDSSKQKVTRTQVAKKKWGSAPKKH